MVVPNDEFMGFRSSGSKQAASRRVVPIQIEVRLVFRIAAKN
jgi:hypothetical protein